MNYSENPHNAPPPLRPDHSIAFERLIPEHRRDYLDGWGHSTVEIPASRPATASKYFNIGSIEALANDVRSSTPA